MRAFSVDMDVSWSQNSSEANTLLVTESQDKSCTRQETVAVV